MTATAPLPVEVRPPPPTESADRPDVLLSAITVAVGAAAVTPFAPMAAMVPPVLVLLGEATGRRPASLAGIVVSTLFAAQAPAGVREAFLVAGAAAVGMLVRLVMSGLTAPVHRALAPLPLLLILVIDFVFRPALTVPGQYAVFEQVVVLLTMTAVLVGGYRQRGEPSASESALHLALVVTALAAGTDFLRAMSAADPADIAGRQLPNIFGASNYLAALISVAIIACVHRACTRPKRAWLHVLAAVVLVGMLLPQASRTSSIVVLVVVAWLLARNGHWGWLLIAGATAGAALVTFSGSIAVLDRFQTGQLAGDELNGRADLWAYGLRAIGGHPLFGVGAGRLSDALLDDNYDVTYVHDVWLGLSAQYGLLGMAFLIVGTWWVIAAPLGPYARLLALTMLVQSTVEPVVETLKMGLLFTAVVALGAAHVAARPVQNGEAPP